MKEKGPRLALLTLLLVVLIFPSLAEPADGVDPGKTIRFVLEGPGSVVYSGSGKRQLYMFNFSLGTAAYLKGRSGLHQPLGMGLSLSYVRDRQFYGVRAVSATFTDWGGRDSSLLYGRAWVSDRSMFSIASGLGSSKFISGSGSFHRIGLPLDIKALLLSSRNGGISFGLHGFAFFTTSYLHFGICLNLGIFVFSG